MSFSGLFPGFPMQGGNICNQVRGHNLGGAADGTSRVACSFLGFFLPNSVFTLLCKENKEHTLCGGSSVVKFVCVPADTVLCREHAEERRPCPSCATQTNFQLLGGLQKFSQRLLITSSHTIYPLAHQNS